MLIKRFKTSAIFLLLLSLLLLILIACDSTTNSNQPIQETTSPNLSAEINTDLSTDSNTGTLNTTNNEEVNKWLIPLISEYLQDDGNTDPRLTVVKSGNGSGTVSSSPSGIDCGLTCSSTYEANTVVTLTAVADLGSSLVSWSGCTSINNNTCTVNINGATTVTATFNSTLSYQGFYITQAAQNFQNTAALAENRQSYARLFITQSSTDHTGIDADLHISTGGNTLKIDLTGPAVAPTNYDEGDLSTSYNAYVPPAWIQTDTTYYVTVSSALGTDIIRNPTTGSLNQNVETAPTFNVVWVPITYNGITPTLTASDLAYLSRSTRAYWPIVDINQSVRASYTFSGALEGVNAGDGWRALLSQISSLRNTDNAASNVYYHAIVDNNAFASGSGIYGIAYRPGKTAVSREHTDTIAHEWGHNFGRKHVAGCSNPSNQDANYPHASGSIGVWGINVFDNSLDLKNPSTWEDTMTYCNDEWVSDYNYDAVAKYRSPSADFIDNRVQQLVLMVSGSISPSGQATLNPSFSFEALADLPNFGAYTVQLISSSNDLLATMNFDSMEIDHSDERHFLVNVPVTQALLSDLKTVQVLDSNGNIIAERSSTESLRLQSVNQTIDASPLTVDQIASTLTISWDSYIYPRVFAKDGIDGSIIAMSETGSINIDRQTLSGSDLEILLSNGVTSKSVVIDIQE